MDIVVDAWRDNEQKRNQIRLALEATLAQMASARFLRLDRLEGVTITDRLDEALAEFEGGGLDTGRTLTRTTGEIVGVAMTPVGIRNGKAYCRIFLLSPTAEEFCRNDSSVTARYIVAHELGHAHDLAVKSDALEPMLLKTPGDLRIPPVFWQIAEIVWNEYAACRLSASEHPAMQESMDEMFEIALGRIRPETKKIIESCLRANTSSGSFERVTPLVTDVLKHGSHVIGHSEGLGSTNPSLSAGLAQSLDLAGWKSGFTEQRTILNGMWLSYGSWPSQDEFKRLLDFIKRSYCLCAVEVYEADSQAKTRFYMEMVPHFMKS